jgi:hypothetical protein
MDFRSSRVLADGNDNVQAIRETSMNCQLNWQAFMPFLISQPTDSIFRFSYTVGGAA